jgi:DNA polymerase III epsilon subunit-like protein
VAPSPARPGLGPTASECWISVDVETAGPNPGGYSLLAIGACRYDDPEQAFYLELAPVNDRAEESALAISGLTLDELATTGTAPGAAMQAFADWLGAVVPTGSRPVFVGFNAGFDWMFVCDYFHRYLGHNPFGHSSIDIKSVAMGALGIDWPETSLRSLSKRLLDGRSLSHDALQDARDQAALLQAIILGHNQVACMTQQTSPS